MSNSNLLTRFVQLEETQLSDHSYLTPEDECYYLGEYTSGEGASHSETRIYLINVQQVLYRTRSWAKVTTFLS